eukprot:4279603-Pyramimonas_sp.AAC.1
MPAASSQHSHTPQMGPQKPQKWERRVSSAKVLKPQASSLERTHQGVCNTELCSDMGSVATLAQDLSASWEGCKGIQVLESSGYPILDAVQKFIAW